MIYDEYIFVAQADVFGWFQNGFQDWQVCPFQLPHTLLIACFPGLAGMDDIGDISLVEIHVSPFLKALVISLMQSDH